MHWPIYSVTRALLPLLTTHPPLFMILCCSSPPYCFHHLLFVPFFSPCITFFSEQPVLQTKLEKELCYSSMALKTTPCQDSMNCISQLQRELYFPANMQRLGDVQIMSVRLSVRHLKQVQYLNQIEKCNFCIFLLAPDWTSFERSTMTLN